MKSTDDYDARISDWVDWAEIVFIVCGIPFLAGLVVGMCI